MFWKKDEELLKNADEGLVGWSVINMPKDG